MVYDHGGHKERPPLFRVTALFTERDGRTQLDMSMAFPTPEIAEQSRGFIKKAGGEATWDRLAEYLGQHCAGEQRFFITRCFDAAIEQVYAMWSDPAHLAQWLPPTGATMRFLRAEPRVGGTSFYAMSFGEGAPMYGLIRYIALDRPTLIVYTQQFCDEHENVVRPPFFADWPLAMRSTVELAAEAPDRTRVRVRWEPQDASAADLAEFVKQRDGMTLGWTGSFDKLEALLCGSGSTSGVADRQQLPNVSARLVPVDDATADACVDGVIDRPIRRTAKIDAELSQPSEDFVEALLIHPEAVVAQRILGRPLVEVDRQSTADVHGGKRPDARGAPWHG
jgi:uncharacterized protein YndB with AHSA1/START domain